MNCLKYWRQKGNIMTKQELKDLMKWSYPRSAEAEEKLLFRVNLFPKSLEIYHDHLQNIYTRSDVWFLLEQLIPEAARESAGGVNPFRKIDNFISHYIYLGGDVLFGSKDVDWKAVYAFIDGQTGSNTLTRVVNKYREQLLVDDYDMI